MPTPEAFGVEVSESKQEAIDKAMEKLFRLLGGGDDYSPVPVADVLLEIEEAKAHADKRVPALYRQRIQVP